MPRFVDAAQDGECLTTRLSLGVGDVVRFSGSGAIVRDGTCLDVVAILTEAIIATDGTVLAPEGPPNVILVRATAPGSATLDLVVGGFGGPADGGHAVYVVVRPG